MDEGTEAPSIEQNPILDKSDGRRMYHVSASPEKSTGGLGNLGVHPGSKSDSDLGQFFLCHKQL